MPILKRIKELRKEYNLTQKAVAKKLNISPNTYSQYENGKIEIKLATLIEIARIFDVSISYLLDKNADRLTFKTIDINTLSKRLKVLRLKDGYTQKELAKQIGLGQSSYSRYGSGIEHILPKTIHLENLANTLNVPVSYLIGETEELPISDNNAFKPTTFAERLSSLRKERGYSQVNLAQSLGISRQAYNKYERGIGKPSKETLEKLAEFLNVSVEYLLCETDERTPKNK